MLSDRCQFCLNCLSVCNAGALRLNRWMDQDATWLRRYLAQATLLDGDLALLPTKKGGKAAPTFRPMSIVAKELDGSRCHLV